MPFFPKPCTICNSWGACIHTLPVADPARELSQAKQYIRQQKLQIDNIELEVSRLKLVLNTLQEERKLERNGLLQEVKRLEYQLFEVCQRLFEANLHVWPLDPPRDDKNLKVLLELYPSRELGLVLLKSGRGFVAKVTAFEWTPTAGLCGTIKFAEDGDPKQEVIVAVEDLDHIAPLSPRP